MTSELDDDSGTKNGTRVRRLIQGLGGASALGVAGCLGGDGDDDSENGDNGDGPDNGDDPNGDDPNGDDPDNGDDPNGDDEPEIISWNRDLEEQGWEADPDAATDWDNYEERQVFDAAEVDGELMEISLDSEGRVWYIERGAPFVTEGDDTCQIGYVDPDTGEHRVALELDVYVGGTGHVPSDHGDGTFPRDQGGQGIAVDPNFAENGYVYVFYDPASTDMQIVGSPYHDDITVMLQKVSRFEFDEDEGVLDPASEAVVMDVPLQIDGCCHVGGCLTFGPEGNLYVTTGDDTNMDGNPAQPEINNFTGDERQGYVNGRPAPISDAQRTSQNTADKRGKILRVTPTESGNEGEMYEIPEGNLKEHWEEETGETYSEEEFLPEIYCMGFRNPFTIQIDEYTGYLWAADYGNDAPTWLNDVGTVGQGTYHLFCEPGNAGFPYFKGYYPNRYYDFEEEVPGQPFWPDNLRNRSPNNTGIENVPNVNSAIIWHPQNFDEYTNVPAWADMPRRGEITWPEWDAGGSADAGVIYRYSDDFGEKALDPYFEGKLFCMNGYNADTIRYLTFDDGGSLEINEFLPGNDIARAYDMKVLPDGRLVIMGMDSGIHVIEYGG